MREWEVVSAKSLGPYRLAVRFADGLAGEVELRESFFRGVFETLRDPAVFERVHCEHGFVEWPGELDLAPDAMHREIAEHGRWVLE